MNSSPALAESNPLHSPADECALPWFALRVRSNFERVTTTILRQKGFDGFLPSYRTKSRWSDRIREIDRPLFPGYVFCRLDLNRMLPVLRTPGVVYIVGNGKTPCAIDDLEMKSLQALVSAQAVIAPHSYLKLGQRVVIRHGRLAGIEGVVEAFRNGYRIVVSITLLQRSVATEVEADWIQPIR